MIRRTGDFPAAEFLRELSPIRGGPCIILGAVLKRRGGGVYYRDRHQITKWSAWDEGKRHVIPCRYCPMQH